MIIDYLTDMLKILINFLIGESNDFQTVCLKDAGADCIVQAASFGFVLMTIDFND